jgi:hypothetical protein
MLYIMHRTQLYLDEDLWTALQTRARLESTTISELVRTAARERYMSRFEERSAAMEAFVGIRKDGAELDDVDGWIRNLRRSGNRMKRIYSE